MDDAGKSERAPSAAHGMASAARAWVGVSMAFVGVISLAVAIFIWRRSERIIEIEDHYARGVAHMGEQVELRYRNYVQIVRARLETPDSVLRLRATLDNLRASEAARSVADQQLAQRERDLTDTREIASRVRGLYDELDGVERELATTASLAVRNEMQANERAGAAALARLACEAANERAQRAARDATAAAETARAQTEPALFAGSPPEEQQRLASSAAEAAALAKTAREDAERALADAWQALPPSTDDANTPAAEAPPLPATPSTSPAPPASAPASSSASARAPATSATETSPGDPPDDTSRATLARAAATEAERDRERAQSLATRAGALLSAALENDRQAGEELVVARKELTQALEALLKAGTGTDRARATAQELSNDVKALQQRVQQSSDVRAAKTSEHAQAVSAADSAKAKLAEILNQTLPSHRGIVERCLKQSAGDAQSCIMGELARQGALAGGLSMVPCPKELQPGSALVRASGDLQTGELVLRGSGTGSACGVVPLDRWLGLDGKLAEPVGSELGFEHVALMTASGQVLYAPGDESGVRIQKLPGVGDKGATSSMLREVEIGTTRYRVFLQPLAVDPLLPCEAQDEAKKGCAAKAELSLIGLVREDRLTNESYRVSPTSFVWAILLVGVGILSLPLAKLWFIGPRSRLRRFDVALLATSAVCVTLLAIVLTLTFAARNRLLARLDGQLQDVASNVTRELSERLDGAATVLDEFVRRSAGERAALKDAQRLSPGGAIVGCSGAFAWLNAGQRGSALPICEKTRATLSGNPRDWTKAFWTNERGQQQIKYLQDRVGTNAIDVSERDYFQRAKAGAIECLAPGRCGDGLEHRGTADVVRSATSGDIVLVVARPTHDADGTFDGMAAVEQSLEGLEHPVLPLGMQLAVVNEDGRVMLHSNNEAHHGQRLFDQVDRLTELRATLATRTGGALMLRYLGVPSRAWVTPIAGTDWHVVTLSPLAVVNAPSASMLLVTLVGFASYVIGMLVLAGGYTFVRDARRRFGRGSLRGPDLSAMSLRPDGTRSRAYASAAIGLIVWAAGGCVAVVCVGSSVPLFILFASSVIVGGVLALGVPGLGNGWRDSFIGRACDAIRQRLARGSAAGAARVAQGRARGGAPSWRDEITLSYALCYFGLAGAFIALPATIWFMGAYDHFAESVVRAEQDHLARALRYRHDCAAALVAGPGADPQHPRACHDLFDGGLLRHSTPNGTSPEPTGGVVAAANAPAPSSLSAPAAASAVSGGSAPSGGMAVPVAHAPAGSASPGSTWLSSTRSSMAQWLGASCSPAQLTWPLRCLVDALPPFEALEGSASARLYRTPDAVQAQQASMVGWGWRRSPRELTLVLPGSPMVEAGSAVPVLLSGEYNMATLALLLGLFAVFLFCAHAVAFHSMRRLFALDVIARWQRLDPASSDAVLENIANPSRTKPGRKWLVLYPHADVLSQLRANAAWQALNASSSRVGGAWYVPNLIEVLADTALLDRVVAAAGSPAHVVLLSAADPYRRLPDPLAARWIHALDGFELVRALDTGSPRADGGESSRSPQTPMPLSRARCELLWEDSDEAERRLLGQLAVDGYANPAPENADTLDQLAARGIIGRHTLTFTSESLRRFVRSKISISELDGWQRADGGSAWNSVRVPLTLSVAAALAIFGTSAPELTATGAALVPTIAAGFPALLRVLLSVAQGETPQD